MNLKGYQVGPEWASAADRYSTAFSDPTFDPHFAAEQFYTLTKRNESKAGGLKSILHFHKPHSNPCGALAAC
jgi:hypothetical protein